jgi:D-hydroxyproline dehydrogenase subunit alpha
MKRSSAHDGKEENRIHTGIRRGRPITVNINGVPTAAHEGETIGAVLAAAGIRTIRHAPQHHDPRGLYCTMGTCHGCLVTVDGCPNVRACITPAAPDQEIILQDGLGRFDPETSPAEPGETVRQKTRVLIIGGGPAGLRAAIAAAEYGVQCLIIDENLQPGGQIYRQLPKAFKVKKPELLGDDYTQGRALIERAAASADRIEIWNDTTVWGVFEPRQVAVIRNNALVLIEADAVVVAAGAYERPVPVPGWTLPGVMTAGGAQALIKSQRIRPGNRILLAGTGPLQLVVANQMLDAGLDVAVVADAASTRLPFQQLFNLFSRFDLLKQGFEYLFNIRKSGVPILASHVLKSVVGEKNVQGAVLCKIDSRLQPIEGTEKPYDVDTVCIGYGLISNTWATRMFGCAHKYVPRMGSWIPGFDENMQTDRDGVFVAGDGAGVAGVLTARCQGAMAGIYAAVHCGAVSTRDAERAAVPYRKKLVGLNRFRRAMDTIYPMGAGLYANITDDTLVCRCEGVTAGEIREAIRQGTGDPNDIKKRTRAGMGYCQGMNCFPTIAMILSREFGMEAEAVKILTPRPPGRPLPLNLLMADLPE